MKPPNLRSKQWLLVIPFGLYAVGLGWVNLFYARYPVDNDLDEIGWLADNLSLGRLESFANENYPFGQMLLLRLLTPVFGSLLTASFVVQTVAMVCILAAGYIIAKAICKEATAGFMAFVMIAVGTLPLATSEFADGTATALVLWGLVALFTNATRGSFFFGLSIGAAFLFRFHYSTLLPIGAALLLFSTCGLLEKLKSCALLVTGFVISAAPLLIINTIEYGNPLNTGISSYIVGHFVKSSSLDWYDFPSTYALWPLGRILAEQPFELITHLWVVAKKIAQERIVQVAAILVIPAFCYAKKQGAWRQVAALVILCAFYTLAVILPTRLTGRAMLPVTVVLSILVASGLSSFLTVLPRWGVALIFVAAVLIATPNQFGHDLTAKRERMLYNRQILTVLRSHGLEKSADVFTDDWGLYNHDDPKFITFVNWGGWILLDSKYAAERPLSTAHTASEWREYFQRLEVKLVVLRSSGSPSARTRDIINNPKEAGLELIYHDSEYHVFNRK